MRSLVLDLEQFRIFVYSSTERKKTKTLEDKIQVPSHLLRINKSIYRRLRQFLLYARVTFTFLKVMLTAGNSIINLLSLLQACRYEYEFNSLVNGCGLSVKDKMSHVRLHAYSAYASSGALDAFFVWFSGVCFNMFCLTRDKMCTRI